MRQKAKVHILGTYKLGGKKYISGEQRTDLNLSNVFIKVEGLNREIMLKNALIRCSKKQHR